MTSEFEVIATRELQATGDGISGVRRMIVEIGRPCRDSAPDGDWTCENRIRGLDEEQRMKIHGVDGIQAIQNALIAISGALRMLQDPPHVVMTFDNQENLLFP